MAVGGKTSAEGEAGAGLNAGAKVGTVARSAADVMVSTAGVKASGRKSGVDAACASGTDVAGYGIKLPRASARSDAGAKLEDVRDSFRVSSPGGEGCGKQPELR